MFRITLAVFLFWISSSIAFAQLYVPEIKVQGTFNNRTEIGDVQNRSGLQVNGDLSLTDSSTLFLYKPGSSPLGSQIGIGSPSSGVGMVLTVGNGNGNVRKRWGVLATNDLFYIQNRTQSTIVNYLIINESGNVGIGGTNPPFKLTVKGNGYFQDGVWIDGHQYGDPSSSPSQVLNANVSASVRPSTRKNITNYGKGLSIVEKLNPVKYELEKDSENVATRKNRQYINIPAHELQREAPELVDSYLNDNDEERLAINQTGLVFVMINSIKELNAKVEEQQRLIDTLLKKK